MIDRCGSATCEAFTADRRAPVEFSVVEVRPPSDYAWTTDGQTTNVPNTNEVIVVQSTSAGPQERTVHIARVNGAWRWFTDCTP